MEKKINDKTAQAIAAAIKGLLAREKAAPPEKTTLELLDERIRALNAQVATLDENPLLKRQVLLQLRTAMKKRSELLGESPKE